MSKKLTAQDFWIIACVLFVIGAPFCAKVVADYLATPHKPPKSASAQRLSLSVHKDNDSEIKHTLTLNHNHHFWSWSEDHLSSPATVMINIQNNFYLVYDKYLHIAIPTESDTVEHMYNLIWPWRNIQFDLGTYSPKECYTNQRKLLFISPPPVTSISALSK